MKDLDVTHVRADQLDRRIENLHERGVQARWLEQLRAQAIELADGCHFARQLCFAFFQYFKHRGCFDPAARLFARARRRNSICHAVGEELEEFFVFGVQVKAGTGADHHEAR